MNRINKVLFYGMFFTTIVFLFLQKYYLFSTTIISFGFAWIFSLVVDREKLQEKHKTLIYISLWLHIFGSIYFYNIIHYDKFLHFLVPFLITSIIYAHFSKNLKLNKIMIFFTVLGMLAFFEIFEYFLEVIFGLNMLGVQNSGKVLMSPLDDTFMDLIMGLLGSTSYLILKKSGEK